MFVIYFNFQIHFEIIELAIAVLNTNCVPDDDNIRIEMICAASQSTHKMPEKSVPLHSKHLVFHDSIPESSPNCGVLVIYFGLWNVNLQIKVWDSVLHSIIVLNNGIDVLVAYSDTYGLVVLG